MAAGSGTRLAAGVPKAFVELAGRTLLAHAADRVVTSRAVDLLVAVVPAAHEAAARAALPPGAVVVVGGASRVASVAAGLAVLPPGVDVVLVHDAARALTPPSLVAEVVAAVRAGHRVVVPGVPVHDTIRTLDRDGRRGAVVDRSSLRAVQTPQGFDRTVLDRAHGQPAPADATDDAGLVERLGEVVHVVPGADEAFKITRPVDLALARALLGQEEVR